jgi:hypothetical protein
MRAIVISAALAAIAALALGAGAASAKSCGATVINDWYVDGTIDHSYPPACYREALSKVTDQDRIYSNLPEQLDRGLRASLASHGVLSTKTTITSSPRSTAGHRSGPIQRVLGELGPDRADSIPIPLLILGSVALLLIAAGTASVIVRRLHGRRPNS